MGAWEKWWWDPSGRVIWEKLLKELFRVPPPFNAVLQPKGIQVFCQLRRQSSFPREDRRTETKTDPHCKHESLGSDKETPPHTQRVQRGTEFPQHSLRLHCLPFLYLDVRAGTREFTS